MWLDNDVDQLVAGISESREQAKKIFEFVRDNFVCTGYNSFRTSGSLKDVFKKKTGTVADINLLLIAMLKSKKIDVDLYCSPLVSMASSTHITRCLTGLIM